MKHIVKLSSIPLTCGLGLFLIGCDGKPCDPYKPPLIQEECTDEDQHQPHSGGGHIIPSSHYSGFFMPIHTTTTTSSGG